jgi:hypothetical protein
VTYRVGATWVALRKVVSSKCFLGVVACIGGQ